MRTLNDILEAIFLKYYPELFFHKINGLMEDCNNSSVLVVELLQSCTEPLKCHIILATEWSFHIVIAPMLDISDKCSVVSSIMIMTT